MNYIPEPIPDDFAQIRRCAPLLPEPGGPVVAKCCDEIDRLRKLIAEGAGKVRVYDEIVAKLETMGWPCSSATLPDQLKVAWSEIDRLKAENADLLEAARVRVSKEVVDRIIAARDLCAGCADQGTCCGPDYPCDRPGHQRYDPHDTTPPDCTCPDSDTGIGPMSLHDPANAACPQNRPARPLPIDITLVPYHERAKVCDPDSGPGL